MHYYESTIITTIDGLHCQVYGNEHPEDRVLVKPKYIPTDKIHCDGLPYRFISGRRVNRLNLWIDSTKLKKYIEDFKNAYPKYVFESPMYDKSPLFFAIPKKYIAKSYSPRTGLTELMIMSEKDLDEHLKKVTELVTFLLKSGLELNDLGITYSTLMGHYNPNISDINVVVYGKKKFWTLMEYLEKNDHNDLRWKNYEEWEEFYKKRNRHMIHNKEKYISDMHRKKSEGFFKDTLFVIFAVENEGETWFKWYEEKYKKVGSAKFRAVVKDNINSVVRPGCYEINESNFIDGDEQCKDIKIKKAVFYSRDYCMLAFPEERVELSGIIEEVTPKIGKPYHRIVIGYLDSYISERRYNEYIKVLDD
jgi:predicted nucleotidyltransferase